MLLPAQSLRARLTQRPQPLLSLDTPVLARLPIPHHRTLKTTLSPYPDLRVVPQRKLSGCQPLLRCPFRKDPRQPLIFLKYAVRTTQKPFAQRHVRLGLALLRRLDVPLQAEDRIELEWWDSVFVCVPELVLCRCVVEVG